MKTDSSQFEKPLDIDGSWKYTIKGLIYVLMNVMDHTKCDNTSRNLNSTTTKNSIPQEHSTEQQGIKVKLQYQKLRNDFNAHNNFCDMVLQRKGSMNFSKY